MAARKAVWWPLDVRFFEDVVMRRRDRQREQGMRATLERIKSRGLEPLFG